MRSFTSTRNATLIELIVAMSLTAGLIALLLGAYRHLHTDGDPLADLWPRYALQQRLEHLLGNMELEPPPQIEEESLLFLFNNGVADTPDYSARTLAYLRREGSLLRLTLWADSEHSRELLLAENVEQFRIERPHPAMLRLTLNEMQNLFYLHASDLYPEFNPR